MEFNFDARKREGIIKRKTVKPLIDSVNIGPDYYTIHWRNGTSTYLYFDDHDSMLNILRKLGDRFIGELIPAQAIADELTILHPDLETRMLRPTGKYGKYYYASLHLEHFLKRIIYLNRGEVFLDKEFYKKYMNGIPERPKQTLDRWLE